MAMNSAGWFLLVGALMLAMGLATPMFRRLPITPAMVYLAVGLLVGPTVFGLFHFNPLKQSALLEVLTEVAVLIALFSAGVKLPVPVTFARWRTPVFLAVFSMTATVALIAGFAHYLLGLSPGAAVLLGAIIAPTDPVLATDTQIRHAEDRDRLRFTLTCEAGMNDGSAFPFVMLGMGLLGLHEIGEFGQRWILLDVVWATLTGIAIGVVAGWGLAHASARLRAKWPDPDLLNDFLGLGLIGVAYGLSLWLNAWGFLAVFFAAVTLRHTELKLTSASQEIPLLPRFEVPHAVDQDVPEQNVSEASLIFKEHLERLSVLVLILLIGGMLFVDSWSWRAVGLALFIFIIVRPLSVMIGLIGTRTTWRFRGLIGWFGARGIGSLYYLMYAIQHGLPEDLALELLQLTLVVVTLSILVHGITAKPMMSRFWHRNRNVR
jgi:NhaP-type Na+/H+ or K+/H+ antiporter